jgi:succinate dehydrogenase / fumarate reductase cytochrome b subunit
MGGLDNNSLRLLYRSSIGKKFVVAITGIALLLFVFGHMAGNLLVYAGKDAINSYGQFLHGFIHGWGVWAARLGILGAVTLHVVATVQLTRQNRAARDVRAARGNTVQATRASRTMIYSGLFVLAFVVYHLLHFTVTPDPGDPGYYDSDYAELTGDQRHDVYAMIVSGFSHWLVSGVYIVAVCLLCSHLSHGFASVFQTLGLRTEKSWPLIEKAGQAYALVILIGNCSIPLSILLGFVSS